jgi:hypothetical protein
MRSKFAASQRAFCPATAWVAADNFVGLTILQSAQDQPCDIAGLRAAALHA